MDTLELKPVTATSPDLRTKAADAPVRLAPVKAAAPPWRGKALRQMSGDALLRHAVGACLAHARPNAEALARGSADPEHVHQLRVGLRRLRSAVRGLSRFAGTLPANRDAAITPVFDALGEARDRFVVDTALVPRLRRAGAPAVDPGGQSAQALATHLQALVRGERFQQSLARLQAFADAEPLERAAPGDGLAHLVGRLRKLARQVTRAAMRFDDLSFEDRHRARKRLKRLRYLAEFAAPAFDRGDVKRWLRAVEPAQDALGEHIDHALAGRRFERLAARDPRAWFAAGWLRAKSERSGRAAARALRRLQEAKAFW